MEFHSIKWKGIFVTWFSRQACSVTMEHGNVQNVTPRWFTHILSVSCDSSYECSFQNVFILLYSTENPESQMTLVILLNKNIHIFYFL